MGDEIDAKPRYRVTVKLIGVVVLVCDRLNNATSLKELYVGGS